MRIEAAWVVLALALAACSPGAATATAPVDAAAADLVPSGPDLAPDPAFERAIAAASWQVLPTAPMAPAGAKQDDLFPVTPTVAYAVSGPASSVYKTSDGGATWTTVFKHAGTYFRSVLFTDEMHGFASNLGPLPQTSITDKTLMYETRDGGATWTPVTRITGPMPSGICNQTMVDATHLVAVGRVNGPAFLMLSGDGGASWTSKDLGTWFTMLIDARFTSPTDGILVGQGVDSGTCTIYRTRDAGDSLDKVFESQAAGSLCWKISFPSLDVGYVSVQDEGNGPATFVKTMDGGATWMELPLPPMGAYPGIGIGFATVDVGWVSSEMTSQKSYRTLDGGMTWQPDATLRSPVNRFRFPSAKVFYAIGGAVWRMDVAGP
jgi:photosystem II stability/assembly factor-like uncharacterized protein